MFGIASIWLPTLVAAVAVFIVSPIVHMVIRWHQNDEARIPALTAFAAYGLGIVQQSIWVRGSGAPR